MDRVRGWPCRRRCDCSRGGSWDVLTGVERRRSLPADRRSAAGSRPRRAAVRQCGLLRRDRPAARRASAASVSGSDGLRRTESALVAYVARWQLDRAGRDRDHRRGRSPQCSGISRRIQIVVHASSVKHLNGRRAGSLSLASGSGGAAPAPGPGGGALGRLQRSAPALARRRSP